MSNWEKLLQEERERLETAFHDCKNNHEAIVVKNSFIGKKSILNIFFSELPIVQKKNINQEWKTFKKEVDNCYKFQLIQLTVKTANSQSQYLPHKPWKKFLDSLPIGFSQFDFPRNFVGSPHPLSHLVEKIHKFFHKFQFVYEIAPQVETVQNNFDFLNIKKNHPSRSDKETFYLNQKTVLRTHATNFTVRQLLKFSKTNQKSFTYHIGNVFRKDTDDATHNQQFLQLDCCMIGENLNLAQLKFFLREFLTFLFGSKIEMQFRLNDFPFTKPSIEIDIWSNIKKCWIEVLGAGIIRPSVLKACKVDKSKVNVLAFGVGLDRLAMILYQIDDIRKIYDNTLTVSR